jgi:hypothetical protein
LMPPPRSRDCGMPIRHDATKWSKASVRAYPVGTIAYYGPDNRRASKVAVNVIVSEGAGERTGDLRRWTKDEGDIREDPDVLSEVAAFLKSRGVRSVALVDRIIGCPHEEGIDYPDGEACPLCPFWQGRDRWTGELLEGGDADG